jgi:tRNA(Ile)-lysidine synthase
MLGRRLTEAALRLGLSQERVLLAVSGGIDSVALAHAAQELAEVSGLKLSIGHVNHGLRGAESEADQAFVEALGGRLGVPVASARVDPSAAREGGSSRDRETLQEAARRLRYAALRRLAEQAGTACVATAHTADDQAETVLLRLLRGTGPDGLAGMPERSPDGWLVRPLLRVSRAEVERFARARGLAWREDASNQCLDYARNRLRQRWLPGLAADFNPRLLNAIADLAEAQRRDSEWIEARVAQEAASRFAEAGAWLAIDARDWASLPEALSRRLARAALNRCGAGRHVARVHLARIGAFLAGAGPGKRLELPGGLRLERSRHGFRLGPRGGRVGRSAC